MKGNRASSIVSSHHDRPHLDVAVGGGVHRGHLVPQGVEPEPRLAGEVPGLVHHSPLVALEMTQARQVGHVGAVGDEQERLGVVGRVQLGRGEQGAVESSGSRHGLEVADEMPTGP